MAYKKTLASAGLAGILATTLPVKDAEAGLIRSQLGDMNSELTLELTPNQYNFNLDSTFDFDQFFIPFASNEDLGKFVFSIMGAECNKSGNYLACNFQNELTSLSGTITPIEGYEFANDFIETRNAFFSANDLGTFETFFNGYVPQFQEVTTQPPIGQVPEPTTLAIFGLGLAGLAYSRREKQTKRS